jgi:hypothetical protein
MSDEDEDVTTDDAPPAQEETSAVEEWRRRRASGVPTAVRVEVVESEGNAQSRGFVDKLRSLVSTGGSAPDDDSGDTPKRRGRAASTANAGDVAKGIIVPIMALGFLAVPEAYRMRDDEMHGVALPLARILLRRFRALRRLSPDLVDAIAILGVLTMYARRLAMESDERKKRRIAEIARARSEAERNSNGSLGGTVLPFASSDPLAAYLRGDVQ